MKFIFPQNYNFEIKLFGVLDYNTIFFNIIWDLFIFIIIQPLNIMYLKICIFFTFCFPLFLLSFCGLNGENFLYSLKYIVKFLIKPKLLLFKKP